MVDINKLTVHLLTYGIKEQVPHRENFNSAIGVREPSAYLDKAARKEPVVLFLGPVHGHEVELTLYEGMLQHEIEKKQ